MSEIMGLAPFYYTSNQKFIVANDDTVKVDMLLYDPGTGIFTPQGLNKSQGFKYEFATYLDGLFCVNHADFPMFYNGSSWSTVTNVTNAPKAKYVIPYLDRLYLLNVDIGGIEHTSRVVSSSLPDTNYNITWDTSDIGNYFDVMPRDGDEITGAGKNFNRLLIFKEESLWKYDTNTLSQVTGAPGTNNNRTIQNVSNITIYFHKTGVQGFDGTNVANISRDIQPIIDGVISTELGKMCSYVDGNNYYIYFGNIYNAVDKIIIDKCMGVYDASKNRWRLKSFQHEPTIFGKYRDDRSDMTYDDPTIDYNSVDKSYDGIISANDYIFFGTSNGKIFKIDKSVSTQDSNKIRAYLETTNYYPNGVQGRSQFQALKFYMESAKRIRLSYSIDDGPWLPIIKYSQNKNEIYYQFKHNVIGNKIKFKMSENGIGERVKIYGIDVFYTQQANIV